MSVSITLPEGALVHRVAGLHLFRRDGRILAVSPATGCWATLDAAEARLLQELERARPLATVGMGTPGAATARQAVVRLVERGILSVNGRLHPAAIPPAPARPSPRVLVLHVMEGCGPACPACAQRAAAGTLATMPAATGQTILAHAVENWGDGPLVVDLTGAEPMQAFDGVRALIQEGQRIASAAGVDIRFLVQTRGRQLNADRVAFLAAHQVAVALTLDAPLETLEGRAGTPHGTAEHIFPQPSRAVLEGWYAAGLDLGLAVVIHDPDAYLPVFDALINLGVRTFRTTLASRLAGGRSMATHRAEEFARGYLALLDRVDAWSRGGGRPVVTDLAAMVRAAATRRRSGPCAGSPCGLGARILSFDPAGRAFACEASHLADPTAFYLGEATDAAVWQGTTPTLASLRSRRIEVIPRCAHCAFAAMCAGGCAHLALAGLGDLRREDPQCRFYQVVYEELLWRLDADPTLLARVGGPGC